MSNNKKSKLHIHTRTHPDDAPPHTNRKLSDLKPCTSLRVANLHGCKRIKGNAFSCVHDGMVELDLTNCSITGSLRDIKVGICLIESDAFTNSDS